MESEDGCAWPLFPLDESLVCLPLHVVGIGNCTVGINGRHCNLQAAPTNTTGLCSAVSSAYCRYVIWIGSILTHVRTLLMEMEVYDLSHLTWLSV